MEKRLITSGIVEKRQTVCTIPAKTVCNITEKDRCVLSRQNTFVVSLSYKIVRRFNVAHISRRRFIVISSRKITLSVSPFYVIYFFISVENFQRTQQRNNCKQMWLFIRAKMYFMRITIFHLQIALILPLNLKNQHKDPISFNPSCLNPEWWEKGNLNFYFHTSLWCLKRFYEGLIKCLHKMLSGNTR